VLAEKDALPALVFSKAKKAGNGYAAKFGTTEIKIDFGGLQEIAPAHPAAADIGVVLPANDFFDDDCLAASNTACGAYVAARFPNNMTDLRSQMRAAKKTLPVHESVEKEAGRRADSYGIGKCLVLSNPAKSSPTVIFAAVSTKRARTGIRSTLSSLDSAIECVLHEANDHRLKSLYLPLFGSGEGGLLPTTSLAAMLSSLAINLGRQATQSVTSVTIVLFQKDPKSEPTIRRRSARRLLDHAARIHDKDIR
jgi:O-acetyl-ADP-ribose deacetylase (regulator of RNase III)